MRTANLKNLIAAWILSLIIVSTASGAIIVVNPGESIQAAIDSASYGDTVEVAAGTYIERITLKDGVAVIGAGDDVTTINGNFTGSVVTSNGCDSNTVLEGFTITDGNAPNGGGMYNVNSSPTVNNCTFSSNTTSDGSPGIIGMSGGNAGHGGGMYNNNSSPFVTNCTFQGNSTGVGGVGGVCMGPAMPGYAGGNGGNGAGIYNTNNSSAILLNCIFTGNAAGAGGTGSSGGDGAGPGMFGGNGGAGGDGGEGGGVYNNNSNAILINCIFNSNSAGAGGNGGDGGDGYEDPVINAKGGNGGSGGDGGDGGGVYNNNCSPVVTNCTFYGNSCGAGGVGGACGTGEPAGVDGVDGSGGYGGGMYNETSSPAVTNCILWGNTPDEIYNSGSSPSVTFCDVSGGYTGAGNIDEDPCFVNAAGGDFHLLFGSLCIDAGTNSAQSLPATDFEGDTRIINGIVDMGADEYICGRATSPSPADSATMVSLDAQLSWTTGVGAVSHDVWFGTDNPPTVLIANDITDTNADPGPLEYGVTYYWQVDENTSEGTVTGDVWSFRTEIWEIWVDDDYWAGGDNDGHRWGIDAFDNIGAGIDMAEYGTTVHVAAGTYLENITLKNGVALIGAGAGIAVIDAGGSGRVVYSSGCDANTILEGFTITGGDADSGGGMYNQNSSPTVTNCVFSENFTSNGGGMYNYGSSPTMTNCTFSANTAGTYGGGMYNYNNSSPTVTNCTFSGNEASVNGGGMGNYNNSRPTVNNCTFISNWASLYGGGMFNSNSSPTVKDCNFTTNFVVFEGGGGMYNYNNSSPTLTNCTFSGNEAQDGGGMHNWGSSPTVTNCTFSGNEARDGGGMYNYKSNPTVTNCTFSGNEARTSGGGMSNEYSSSPTVTNCTFSGNEASVNGGGMGNNDGSPVVTDCNFTGNVASDNGGGMYNYNSSPSVTNCTFSGNTATNDGGGIYNERSSPTVTNCTFSGNLANSGGGMYNYNNSSPSVTNCTFSGNSAGSDGGGMDNYGSSPTMTNCTFSYNTALGNGGGMYNYNSNPTVTNCILWGNTAPTGPQIYGGSPTITYSDVQGGLVGAGNIDEDPCFVDVNNPDPNLWNLRLSYDSPCIDAGDTTAVPTGVFVDAEGNPRVLDDPQTTDTGISLLGVTVDMGAYEFQPCNIAGDNNCDGVVDFRDVAILCNNWLAGL